METTTLKGTYRHKPAKYHCLRAFLRSRLLTFPREILQMIAFEVVIAGDRLDRQLEARVLLGGGKCNDSTSIVLE